MNNPSMTPAASAAPRGSGVSCVPTARYRVRPKTNMVEMIIRYKGKDASPRSTGIRLKPGEKWQRQSQSIEGNPHAANYLRKLLTELDELYYKLDRTGKSFTAHDLSDYFFGKREWNTQAHNLLGAIDAYNASRQPEVQAGQLTERVFKRYSRYRRIFREFLLHQYKTDCVTLDSLKPVLGNELISYFKARKKYESSTYIKLVRYLKTVLAYAVASDWTHRNVLATFRLKSDRKPKAYLREEELKAIESLRILDPHLAKVRDMFVFACWTGFAYTDLASLQQKHLIVVNGVWCLVKPRNKMKEDPRTTQFVPLLPISSDILHAYKAYHDKTGYLLPVPSNQHYNRFLKALAVAAGIDRIVLTTHVARRTFATTMLNLGLDMESVASMVGHITPETTRQFYAELHQKTVITRVLAAFQNKSA